MVEETVNINPDGSTTFEGGESTVPPPEDAGGETFEEIVEQGGDPAFYLLLVVILLGVLFYIYKRKSKENEDEFFGNLDGSKVCAHAPSSSSFLLLLRLFPFPVGREVPSPAQFCSKNKDRARGCPPMKKKKSSYRIA